MDSFFKYGCGGVRRGRPHMADARIARRTSVLLVVPGVPVLLDLTAESNVEGSGCFFA